MRKATAVPVMTAATTAISIIVPDPYTPPPPESKVHNHEINLRISLNITKSPHILKRDQKTNITCKSSVGADEESAVGRALPVRVSRVRIPHADHLHAGPTTVLRNKMLGLEIINLVMLG